MKLPKSCMRVRQWKSELVQAPLIGGNRSAPAKLTLGGLRMGDAVVGLKEQRLALFLCNRMLAS